MFLNNVIRTTTLPCGRHYLRQPALLWMSFSYHSATSIGQPRARRRGPFLTRAPNFATLNVTSKAATQVAPMHLRIGLRDSGRSQIYWPRTWGEGVCVRPIDQGKAHFAALLEAFAPRWRVRRAG